MKFEIIVYNSFEKDFLKTPKHIQLKVIQVIESLKENPIPAKSKKLINREGRRIRIGDYRLLYDVDLKAKFVYLRKLSHRKDIYR